MEMEIRIDPNKLFMHQSIESPGGGGAGKWPGDAGLILFSTPKCCPAGWGHN